LLNGVFPITQFPDERTLFIQIYGELRIFTQHSAEPFPYLAFEFGHNYPDPVLFLEPDEFFSHGF